MIVKLDEKACSLDADELVAFVRLSFNADKDGYVYGSNKELSNKIGMSVAKVKKAIEGLFEKQMLSIGSGKVFIWKHEDNIEFAEGEESKPHKNEPERIALNNVPSVQQVDDKAKKVCEYFNKVIVGRGMPLVHALTSKRKSMINSRLKEYGSEQMKLMIDMASFDWIMRPNNFVKVLEGNYDDRKQGTNKDAEQGYYQESADLVQRLNQQRKATNIQ